MKYKTHNDEPINTDGTHLQGYIQCCYAELLVLFGRPDPSQLENGYKVDWEWQIEFSDGTVATIYNWKNGPNYCGEAGLPAALITEWHVGGFDKTAVLNVDSLLHKPSTASIIDTILQPGTN